MCLRLFTAIISVKNVLELLCAYCEIGTKLRFRTVRYY